MLIFLGGAGPPAALRPRPPPAPHLSIDSSERPSAGHLYKPKCPVSGPLHSLHCALNLCAPQNFGLFFGAPLIFFCELPPPPPRMPTSPEVTSAFLELWAKLRFLNTAKSVGIQGAFLRMVLWEMQLEVQVPGDWLPDPPQ